MPSRTLRISDDLKLPLELATQATAIFGIREGGKTNTAGVIAEECLRANIPIVVLDPTDAWWGLRSSRDGQENGFPVFIFGGNHGDVPLEETGGKVIAEFVVRERVPVILSLRHLRKGAQRRFVTEFCEEIYHLKGKPENRTPLAVFIDESPTFIPQKVMGEAARTVGAVEDLVAKGRNVGFGVFLIAPRPTTLNADVRSLCDTIITHRMTGKLDRTAFKGWIEENASTEEIDEIISSLAKLQTGEAWVWSPRLDVMRRVQMRLRDTFDSSKTPKLGESVKPPKKLAEIDRERLTAEMSEAAERVKQNEPSTLRAANDALRKKLDDSVRAQEFLQKALGDAKGKVDPTRVNAVAKKMAERAVDKLARTFFKRMAKLQTEISESIETLKMLNGEVDTINSDFSEQMAEVTELSGKPWVFEQDLSEVPVEITYVPLAPSADDGSRPFALGEIRDAKHAMAQAAALLNGIPGSRVDPPANVTPAQQRILDTMALLERLRVAPTMASLAAWYGKHPRNKTFLNNLGALRSAGLVEDVRLTDAGKMVAFAPDMRPASLRERIMRPLSPAQRSIMENVLAEPGVTVENLAYKLGRHPRNKTFMNNLGALRSRELVTRGSTVRPGSALAVFNSPAAG